MRNKTNGAATVGLRGLRLPRAPAVLLSQHHSVFARGARWAAWDFDALQCNRFQAQRERNLQQTLEWKRALLPSS